MEETINITLTKSEVEKIKNALEKENSSLIEKLNNSTEEEIILEENNGN